jgi:hypothetical protein
VIRDTKFCIGLDLGQAADYTALCVAERMLEPTSDPYTASVPANDAWGNSRLEARRDVEQHYHIRHLARAPLRTSYHAIAERVVETVVSLRDEQESRADYVGADVNIVLAIDATGVGVGVTEIIARALKEDLPPGDPRVTLVPITLTGGERVNRSGAFYRVPKRDIVHTTIAAFQSGRLRIASSLREAKTLREELLNFKMKINPETAHDSYSHWREGQHDDLVLATAMAVWVWERAVHRTKHVPMPETVAEEEVYDY